MPHQLTEQQELEALRLLADPNVVAYLEHLKEAELNSMRSTLQTDDANALAVLRFTAGHIDILEVLINQPTTEGETTNG